MIQVIFEDPFGSVLDTMEIDVGNLHYPLPCTGDVMPDYIGSRAGPWLVKRRIFQNQSTLRIIVDHYDGGPI